MNNHLRLHQWRLLAIFATLALLALGATACVRPVLPTGSDAAATDVAAAEPASGDTTAAAAPATALPAATEVRDGIPVGFTPEGYAFRGDANAPVTMVEYSDFECPFCARYFVQTEPAINDSFVRDGTLRVIFRDFPIVELHPNAPAAHLASLCVADQGAALYWEMHAKLFQTQSDWGNATDPAPAFERLATEAGADVAAYQACLADPAAKQALIDVAIADGEAAGVSGTPSFEFQTSAGDRYLLVGAQPFDQFALYIEALAKGEKPPVAAADPAAETQAELPPWATAAGWQPDPDRPGFNVAGDQYRGNTDAKTVVMEFTDFQCPYCRQHTLETQPTLDEKFVDTGDVLWVFRHYPLSFHPQAEAASVAAECAANQGKFWEMHDLLFQEQESWSVSEPRSKFLELAKQLSLDAAQFETCIDDPATLQSIQSDQQSVQLNGTPTFVIFLNGELAGQPIGGALPTETFVGILQKVVDEANK